MRYVNVCGQSQEANTPFDTDRCFSSVPASSGTYATPQTKRPDQNRCEPINVTKLNGKNQRVGMAYVPGQSWKETYEDEKGFMRGTIFPELDQPFHPNMGGRNK